MCKHCGSLYTQQNPCYLKLSNDDKNIKYICEHNGREKNCERYKQGQIEQKEKSELFNKVVFELNTIKSIDALIEDLKKQKEKAIKKAAQVYYWSKYKCPNDEVQKEVDRLHHRDYEADCAYKKEREK